MQRNAKEMQKMQKIQAKGQKNTIIKKVLV